MLLLPARPTHSPARFDPMLLRLSGVSAAAAAAVRVAATLADAISSSRGVPKYQTAGPSQHYNEVEHTPPGAQRVDNAACIPFVRLRSWAAHFPVLVFLLVLLLILK